MGRGRAVWLLLVLPLAAVLPVTAARLLEPVEGRAVWLVAFTPLGVPVHAAVLVAALVAIALGTGRRLLLAVPALVAAVGLGLHAWWAAPLHLGDAPTPAAGAERLVVVSANVHQGEGDVAALVAQASEAGADVLVVCELTPDALARMQRAGVDEAFPHRGGRAAADTGGTVVFSRTPVRVEEELETLYGGWVVRTGGRTLLAAHPAAPTDPQAWRRDHAAVRAAALAADADLVVGDLNATLDHVPMQRLADDGYRDAAELANEGWQPTWPEQGLFRVLGLPVPTLVAIDHVLLNDGLTALGTRTFALDGSDHRVLVAELAAR